MSRDTLDQHTRQLDLVVEALGHARDFMRLDVNEHARTWDAIAELRDEILALSNRVESLTRAANGRDLHTAEGDPS